MLASTRRFRDSVFTAFHLDLDLACGDTEIFQRRANGGAFVDATLRAKHYSPRTEEAYVGWIRRFIRFHQKRHPRTMGKRKLSPFSLRWPWDTSPRRRRTKR